MKRWSDIRRSLRILDFNGQKSHYLQGKKTVLSILVLGRYPAEMPMAALPLPRRTRGGDRGVASAVDFSLPPRRGRGRC